MQELALLAVPAAAALWHTGSACAVFCWVRSSCLPCNDCYQTNPWSPSTNMNAANEPLSTLPPTDSLCHSPSWNTESPPIPLPTSTPQRVRSSWLNALALASLSRPACARAFLPDTMVYFRQSSYRRAFFLSINLRQQAVTISIITSYPWYTAVCMHGT